MPVQFPEARRQQLRLAGAVVVGLSLLQAPGSLGCAEGSSSTGAAGESGSPRQAWKRGLDLGEAALERGEFVEALGHFVTADAVELPEAPNYEALPGIAEASCRLGDRATGQAILADLHCILDVDSGAIPCYVGQETPGAPGHPNPALTPLCFERMCGEILLAYYDSPSESQRARIERVRLDLGRLEEICDETLER